MRRALIVLLAVEILCFAPHFLQTGFYLDDWAMLRNMMPHGRLDLSAGIRAFAAGFWNRPLQILHYPALIAFGGLSPWRYRLVIACLELLTGLLLVAWLRRMSCDAGLAVLGAALALVYPSYGAVHVWWTMTTQWVSLSLVLASMLLHLRHLESRPPRRFSAALALGQLCYLLAVLEYEAFAFVPLAMAVFLSSRAHVDREGGRIASVARSLAPYAMSFAVAAFFQRLVFPWLWGPPPRPVAFSPRHVFDVYRAAFACLTSDVSRLMLESATQSFRSFPAYSWAALAAGAAVVSAGIRGDEESVAATFASRRVLLATGALLMGVSYIPYALSGLYTPRIHGVMNRINMGGGVGAGLFMAALLRGVPSRWRFLSVRPTLVAATLALFALCHWVDGARWSAAWRMQQGLVRDISARLPSGSVTVLLVGTPHTLNGAPVFQNHYDLSTALALRAGRGDVTANWIYEGHTGPDEVEIINGDGNTFRYSYERLYAFDGVSRRLVPVNRP